MSDNPYAPPPPSPPNPYGAPPPNPYGAPPNPYGAPPNPYGAPQANPQYQSPSGGFNPYAPPQADLYVTLGEGAGEGMLAERGTRLGASMLDGLLYGGVAAVGAAVGAIFDEDAIVLVAFALMTVLAIYQWYLIATTGQSLAKKWLGIRIVRVDGTPLGFLYGVFLRSWVTQLVAALIPLGGLIDPLLIFGDDRRCLHDHIAGTKVVVAIPES